MVRFGEKGGAWLRLFIFGKIHNDILELSKLSNTLHPHSDGLPKKIFVPL